MKLIAVRLDLNGDTWEALHYDEEGQPDSYLIEEFSTHIVPTPFRAAMPLADVMAELRRLNPDRIVAEGGHGNSFRVA